MAEFFLPQNGKKLRERLKGGLEELMPETYLQPLVTYRRKYKITKESPGGELVTEEEGWEIEGPPKQIMDVIKDMEAYLPLSQRQALYSPPQDLLEEKLLRPAPRKPELDEAALIHRFHELVDKEDEGTFSEDEAKELASVRAQLDAIDEQRWLSYGKPFYEEQTRRQTEELKRLEEIGSALNEMLRRLSPTTTET